ncbi:uncharacterized protein si:dkeyp-55f12.3 isoform X1 [Rhincodon typus]|uniref:uncharacterized protein si:dkeyp-55f12.3 isoform X1 n=1 Tax=Rhincodon typus TaxID=259920 RepID=UPI00203002EE|nr:uncharacterized protein si:dkeyp-55f12.3 isoform X1 [Rhincodon typus]
MSAPASECELCGELSSRSGERRHFTVRTSCTIPGVLSGVRLLQQKLQAPLTELVLQEKQQGQGQRCPESPASSTADNGLNPFECFIEPASSTHSGSAFEALTILCGEKELLQGRRQKYWLLMKMTVKMNQLIKEMEMHLLQKGLGNNVDLPSEAV